MTTPHSLTSFFRAVGGVPLDGGLVPTGSRVEVFRQIFDVFLALGTLVGIVVIGYMVYNAYKYQETPTGEEKEEASDRPQLGEVPQSGGGGKKLFLSFSLSAIIVISLIVWTYGTLLYVEQGSAAQGQDDFQVDVIGYQFGWKFQYPNGHTTNGVLRVPVDQTVQLRVTSEDVFHTFGAPELRVKTDAIPGQTTDTWFIADQTGTYEVQCYELCGAGHSFMTAEIIVMERSEFQAWYQNTTGNSTQSIRPAPEVIHG